VNTCYTYHYRLVANDHPIVKKEFWGIYSTDIPITDEGGTKHLIDWVIGKSGIALTDVSIHSLSLLHKEEKP